MNYNVTMDLKLFLTRKIKDLSIQWKIIFIIIFILFLFTIILFVFILPSIKSIKLEERKDKLSAVVNSIVSLMDYYEKSLRRGDWDNNPFIPETIQEAQGQIMHEVRQMRYEKNEYFFILDGQGRMVMNPLNPELEGKNVISIKDPRGNYVFKNIVLLAQRDGETFVTYLWKSKYNELVFEQQTSYARHYWPWDWIVCSGVYTQDILDSIQQLSIIAIFYIIGIAIITSIILLVLINYNLIYPLQNLLSGIRAVNEGNDSYQIHVLSNDEIGYISSQFNNMVLEQKNNREKILASELKYKNLITMLPDIVYEANRDLKITYLNRAGKELLGYSEEDIITGLQLKDVIIDEKLDSLSEVIKLYQNRDRKDFRIYKIKTKDEGFILGENNAVIIFENDEIKGIRGVIRDVTEKLKMEQNYQQAQKMDTIGTLAGGLAHDFNNVLTGIIGSISILIHELNTKKDLNKEMINRFLILMEESGYRASDMVQQLLTLSRKQELTFAPVDLNLTIKHVIKICENTFDKSIELDANYKEKPSVVNADPTQLEQVVLNLCINANHAMTIMRNKEEKQGGKLSLFLDVIHADKHFCFINPEAHNIDYWRLSVKDTGVGITIENQEKIFDPFFSTKKKGKGTGLGLAMVYNIIKRHDGFIQLHSEIGRGSVFQIYLPLINQDKYREKQEEKEEIIKGKGLILVLDDEEINRNIATSILVACGYDVLCAADGEEGLQIYQEKHQEIAAVLLDLVMPKKSGERTYLEMKEINKDVKVLLASGFKQDERIATAVDEGVNGFIQKPYTLEKLSKAIHSILN